MSDDQRGERRIRSSLRGPARNIFSVAYVCVFLLSSCTLVLGRSQGVSLLVFASAIVALVGLFGAAYSLWNRVGWIDVDVDASSFVVHTHEIDHHRVSLKESFEWIEGRREEFQVIAFRQGTRVALRYRNETAADERRWRALNPVCDRIIPSLLVSTEVGRALHLLVRESAAYRVDYVDAALSLTLAFSSIREREGAELAN